MSHSPESSPPQEQLVDEASVESFPASDAPAWSSAHVGGPSPRPWTAEHARDVRAFLRADIDRLTRVVAAEDERRAAREELMARALLDARRAVVRGPIDDRLRVRNVEAYVPGAELEAPCVVLGARYDADDVSGAAMLVAVVRALATFRMRRTVRFVAFADVPGSVSGADRYSERLLRAGIRVHAMASLRRVDFNRDRAAVMFFVGNLRSAPVVQAAGEAFRRVSRIPVRTMLLPSWLPGVRGSDHAAFRSRGHQAMMIADAPPWVVRTPRAPDVDRMTAALPGLVAVLERLAGGHV